MVRDLLPLTTCLPRNAPAASTPYPLALRAGEGGARRAAVGG